MVPTVIEKQKYTYKDYLKTSDDKRYELVEGGLLMMTPSPTPKHQILSGKIGFELRRFITDNGLGVVLYAPCDVYLDDENVVQPDIMFISKDRLNIIGEKNIQSAPDLTIEIVSESSAYRDMVQKKKLYARFGVMEYWIVIPEEEAIDIYVLKGNACTLYKRYTIDEILESPSITGLRIELREIF